MTIQPLDEARALLASGKRLQAARAFESAGALDDALTTYELVDDWESIARLHSRARRHEQAALALLEYLPTRPVAREDLDDYHQQLVHRAAMLFMVSGRATLAAGLLTNLGALQAAADLLQANGRLGAARSVLAGEGFADNPWPSGRLSRRPPGGLPDTEPAAPTPEAPAPPLQAPAAPVTTQPPKAATPTRQGFDWSPLPPAVDPLNPPTAPLFRALPPQAEPSAHRVPQAQEPAPTPPPPPIPKPGYAADPPTAPLFKALGPRTMGRRAGAPVRRPARSAPTPTAPPIQREPATPPPIQREPATAQPIRREPAAAPPSAGGHDLWAETAETERLTPDPRLAAARREAADPWADAADASGGDDVLASFLSRVEGQRESPILASTEAPPVHQDDPLWLPTGAIDAVTAGTLAAQGGEDPWLETRAMDSLGDAPPDPDPPPVARSTAASPLPVQAARPGVLRADDPTVERIPPGSRANVEAEGYRFRFLGQSKLAMDSSGDDADAAAEEPHRVTAASPLPRVFLASTEDLAVPVPDRGLLREPDASLSDPTGTAPVRFGGSADPLVAERETQADFSPERLARLQNLKRSSLSMDSSDADQSSHRTTEIGPVKRTTRGASLSDVLLDPHRAEVEAIEVGSTIADRYQLLSRLGAGGMGSVFGARDLQLREDVALKLFHERTSDPAGLDRFRQEMLICRRLQHPNIVRTWEFGSWRGHYFYTMELLDGFDLEAAVVRRGKPYTPSEGLPLLLQICDALQMAHDQGVVHRDIKPHNIFLSADGATVKVTDFGVAKSPDFDRVATSAGVLVGTPAYMSPERLLAGDNSIQSTDLWALGVLTYYLFTLQLPFPGTYMAEVIPRIIDGKYIAPEVHNPQLPAGLAAAIQRMLMPQADKRLPSLEVVQAVFRRLLTSARR